VRAVAVDDQAVGENGGIVIVLVEDIVVGRNGCPREQDSKQRRQREPQGRSGKKIVVCFIFQFSLTKKPLLHLLF
jgi:hypothetical protein